MLLGRKRKQAKRKINTLSSKWIPVKPVRAFFSGSRRKQELIFYALYLLRFLFSPFGRVSFHSFFGSALAWHVSLPAVPAFQAWHLCINSCNSLKGKRPSFSRSPSQLGVDCSAGSAEALDSEPRSKFAKPGPRWGGRAGGSSPRARAGSALIGNARGRVRPTEPGATSELPSETASLALLPRCAIFALRRPPCLRSLSARSR